MIGFRKCNINRGTIICGQILCRKSSGSSSREHVKTYPAVKSAVGLNNYDEMMQRFKLNVPDYFNFAENVLDVWAHKEQLGDRPSAPPAFWWVSDQGEALQLGFQDLRDQSSRLANVLQQVCEVAPHERVIVILPKVPEWWLVNIACLRTGAVICPGPMSLTAKDILMRLQASKSVAVITNAYGADLVEQVAGSAPSLKYKLLVEQDLLHERKGWIPMNKLVDQASPEHACVKSKSSDPMCLFFTSGTTGPPKMTEHTHASYGIGHIVTGKHFLDLTPADVMWNVSDTGWAKSAYSSFFAPWSEGSCVFVHDSPRFDAVSIMKILDKYPITVNCLPPTAYRIMVQEDLTPYAFRTLRHSVSAGEPLNPEVIEKWFHKTGLVIREGYGQTELTLTIGNFRCIPVKLGSMGKTAPGYHVHIIDENGKELPRGKEGDIAVQCHPHRPVGLFTHYVDDPERTAMSFRGKYYLTGDRGIQDKDDYFWFVGRADDVIISAGYRIGPFEVESALIEHPAVAESAVVSSPDKTRGMVVKAFVVLSSSYKGNRNDLVKELQDHVKKHTAPYKYPRKIEFVDSLPKTISGKIRRVELRDKEWEKY